MIILELWPEGQALGLAHIQWPREWLLGNLGCGCHLGIPLSCSRSLVTPRKELILLFGAPISATNAQGTPPDRLALGSVELMLIVPEDCIYVHTFTS